MMHHVGMSLLTLTPVILSMKFCIFSFLLLSIAIYPEPEITDIDCFLLLGQQQKLLSIAYQFLNWNLLESNIKSSLILTVFDTNPPQKKIALTLPILYHRHALMCLLYLHMIIVLINTACAAPNNVGIENFHSLTEQHTSFSSVRNLVIMQSKSVKFAEKY